MTIVKERDEETRLQLMTAQFVFVGLAGLSAYVVFLVGLWRILLVRSSGAALFFPVGTAERWSSSRSTQTLGRPTRTKLATSFSSLLPWQSQQSFLRWNTASVVTLGIGMSSQRSDRELVILLVTTLVWALLFVFVLALRAHVFVIALPAIGIFVIRGWK